jgi:hypothetical protein
MRGYVYHFLRRALCQGVTVPQVVDLDILDVVTVGDIDIAIELRCALGGIRSSGVWGRRGRGRLWRHRERTFGLRHKQLYRADWRNVDVLNALASLQASIDFGRRRS